jgi:hypothetical protein
MQTFKIVNCGLIEMCLERVSEFEKWYKRLFFKVTICVLKKI